MAATYDRMTLKQNDIIFREGDSADCMYKILYGDVSIYLNYGKPGEKFLSHLYTGDFFGEMALIDDTVRSAAAVCESDTLKLAVFPKSNFEDIVKEDAAPFKDLLSQMSSRLRSLTDKYMDVCRVLAEYQKVTEQNTESGSDLMKDIEKYADAYKTDR